jgi:hypothetical protein
MQIMSVLELMEALDRKEKEEIVIAKSASPGGKKRKVEDAVDSSELIARVRTLPLASLRREVGGSGGKNKMLIKALGAMDTRSALALLPSDCLDRLYKVYVTLPGRPLSLLSYFSRTS